MNVAASYDAVAREYDRRIYGELRHKPFDRTVLERFAKAVRVGGTVADVGCGPGHVGRHVSDQGVRVCGVDLSEEMLAIARTRNPAIEFFRADMRAIPRPDASWAGIVAFYSIIHIPREEIVSVLRELARVLEPGGLLLLAFHIGDEAVHLEEWWEQRVSVDFFFFQPEEMKGWLAQAGLEVIEVLERDPYAEDVEHQSRRCLITARKAPRPSAPAS